jgi:TRAP-type C4-dicarboxylate transport system substrate-binding protein
MALQTGTIDGVYTNLDGEHRTKLDEVAPHVYTCRELWIGVPYFYAVNLDKWNSLPKDIQQQMLAAGKAAAVRFAGLFNEEWDRTIAEQKKMNCTVTAASPEDIQKWVSMPAITELQNVWVKEMKDRGMKDADDILARMKVLVAEAIAAEK